MQSILHYIPTDYWYILGACLVVFLVIALIKKIIFLVKIAIVAFIIWAIIVCSGIHIPNLEALPVPKIEIPTDINTKLAEKVDKYVS